MAADGELGGRGDLLAIAKDRPNKHCNWVPTPVATKRSNDPNVTEITDQRNRPNKLGQLIGTTYLPTPTGRDFKDTPGMARTAKDGRDRDDQLPRRIYADAATMGTGTARGGMRLTPEFLCWLMGYPPDWLKPLRAVPATQLCRKSSNPSPEPSNKC
jgi:hypothetical protein